MNVVACGWDLTLSGGSLQVGICILLHDVLLEELLNQLDIVHVVLLLLINELVVVPSDFFRDSSRCLLLFAELFFVLELLGVLSGGGGLEILFGTVMLFAARILLRITEHIARSLFNIADRSRGALLLAFKCVEPLHSDGLVLLLVRLLLIWHPGLHLALFDLLY